MKITLDEILSCEVPKCEIRRGDSKKFNKLCNDIAMLSRRGKGNVLYTNSPELFEYEDIQIRSSRGPRHFLCFEELVVGFPNKLTYTERDAKGMPFASRYIDRNQKNLQKVISNTVVELMVI